MPPDEPSAPPGLGEALAALLESTELLPASEVTAMVEMAGRLLGSTSARMLVVDYSLTSLQQLGDDGPTGPRQLVEGTLAGRALAGAEIMVSDGDDGVATVLVPLSEGSERLGVLELVHPAWHDDLRPLLDPVVRILVLLLISKRRYTDVVLRSRRSEPLSPAAEMQWDLLPPLTCSTGSVSVSGILEPAYSIGGDSFDYALNPGGLDFAIVDAVGHGMPAVLLSVSAINSLRNARREGMDLETAYMSTGLVLEELFGVAKFVTGQVGSLTLESGDLTWLNAGHPLPLLVRGGAFIGELACRPSLPMGLGGTVSEIATEHLQSGDRVLFYTDGVVETRSPDTGEEFGVPRLADLLVRATLDGVFPAETARRLSASIMAYNGAGLSDDATLLVIDYHGPPGSIVPAG
jgi:serine phosphatase RsbU (regulator of sigma subunit)